MESSNEWKSVVYHKGLFFAISDTNQVISSFDGLLWKEDKNFVFHNGEFNKTKNILPDELFELE